MKILTLHCDYIKFQSLKKALKKVDDFPTNGEVEIKDPLVVLTAVEKGDNDKTIKELIEAVSKTASEVKAKNIVLYPYAHLSSNLANPETALSILQDAEKKLSKEFNVTRAPFGYYKTFELKCKGHPLSELSKEFSPSKEDSKGKVVEESYDISRLLKEISRSRLDTSKLKDNDHRILGQKLDLFSFNEVAPGAVFWHHKGYIIYKELENFMRSLLKNFNYKEIATPQVLDSKLFKVSGHWTHYKENMFLSEYENRTFGVKPMNCPGGMLVYKSQTRSYKDLPLRLSEFGIDHRMELSGVLAGLFRLVQFTQDDAHIFCTKEQIKDEIQNMLEMIKIVYKDTFKFDYSLELSTCPEKFMGDRKDWDDAEKILEKVLKESKVKFKVNKGDGAFYGPKIDLHVKDSLGRFWQLSTIQLDMQMPKRFELKYKDKDNIEKTPLVIHRAILGAIERFIGILLEHTNGNLPLWLSPIQVRIINFTDRNNKAVEKLEKELKDKIQNLRIDIDLENTTVGDKIRKAELMKIPYIIVIGDKEEESKTLAVRERGQKPKFGIKIEKFIEEIREKIEKRN
ncbi:threonine--tRNA ligase [Candidatus Pacearchaeota archaeon]|nr:threonine--tRNA ligase [Candidatus Pacearchaeota archaeon]